MPEPLKKTASSINVYSFTHFLIIFLITLVNIDHSIYCQPNADLSIFINQTLEHKDFFGAQVGYRITDLNGKVISQQNENIALIPASTMKLVSTLSALAILGKHYKFETKVLFDKNGILDSTLDGDLIVVGSGDPSFAGLADSPAIPLENIISTIISGLKTNGITCIDGDIIIDNSLFEEQAVHDSWPWDDLSNYYAAGPQALNFNENQYKLYFNRTVESDVLTTVDHTEPMIAGLQLISKVKTGPKGSGDNAYIYGAPTSWTKEIKGTIPPGKGHFCIKGALPNPALLFGQTLQRELTSVGIYNNDVIVSNQPIHRKEHQLLCRIQSVPLIDLVKHTNYISNNLYADALLKKLGSVMGQGSYKSGKKVVEDHLSQLEIDMRSIQIQDGSGLSTRNRISPAFLSTLIQKKTKNLGLDVIQFALPQAGVSGSVKGLLAKKGSSGNVWLKSGSMGRVQTYAGIIETKAGNIVIVSFMSNGHSSGNSKIRRHFANIFDHIYYKF